MIPLFDWKKHSIIMESHFDYEGYDFLFFDEGIPFFSLYRGTRKINTKLELKYVGEVLLYLNPEIDYEYFIKLMLELSDRANGHVIRTYSVGFIRGMCESIYRNFSLNSTPYVRRYRKIIFNPSKRITKDEKMAIVGHIVGGKNKITDESIYEAVETLMETSAKITLVAIAETLDCSRQTIYRKITAPIKEIINHHNKKFGY